MIHKQCHLLISRCNIGDFEITRLVFEIKKVYWCFSSDTIEDKQTTVGMFHWLTLVWQRLTKILLIVSKKKIPIDLTNSVRNMLALGLHDFLRPIIMTDKSISIQNIRDHFQFDAKTFI